ncbi:pitrilysin family protein [Aliiroseovarius sp.]|uniref:M16 family metallopeptidase n=1 Tax=Aliiroseovarius sp. TaxID=1872442 RepID=UPI0026381B57|nr:pitrilysin family protein [Aliiroseovarius sp.]
MKRLLSLAASLAAVLTNPALAREVTDFTLDNGMQVVVIEDHRAPVVVNMVWYRVGAADEASGKSGIAHFFEHLMFKATDELESGELSRIVEANGGSDNAFTSQDYTAYFQRVAADRLELMMQMEADRMRDLTLTEEEVATERNVILEERATRTDSDPGALFREQMNAAAYLNHPYGVPIIGWRHEIEQLDYADALSFYRTYYAPNNAIAVIAGDVDPEEVRALAEKYYGVLEPSPDLPERARPQEPPQLAERRLSFSDPRVGRPYLVRRYQAPERDPGDQETAAALVYLAEILGGEGATSVLGRALQFENPKAVFTSAGYRGTSLDDASFSLVAAPVDGISLEEMEAAMDAVIAGFFETGIDPEQFSRLKMQLRASEIYEQDNVQTLADEYGRSLTSGLTLEDVAAWPDVLQAVTEEEVMEAARMVFDRRRSVTGFVRPENGEMTQ